MSPDSSRPRRTRRWAALASAATLACAMTAAAGAATGASAATGSRAAGSAASCPWVHSRAPIAARVSQLLGQMTLDDKLAMVDGVGYANGTTGYVGHIAANPALCIPGLNLEDGPQGVADGVPGVTQLPAPVALAAAWDPALAREYGTVVGSEERGKGADVNLGLTVNIVRDPRWGRAFESYGEDPYLAGQTAVGYIGGVQSQGVMSQVKHFAVYNQETNRNTAADDAVVSPRAIHEIYLPQFQAAVQQARTASVMCSYSSVNGQFACQNSYLLNVLDHEWHFPGFVTSDWGATHSTVPSALAGLDMNMPGGAGFGTDYYGAPLKAAVQAGQVPMPVLNGMVSRILTEMFRFNLFANPPTGSLTDTVTTPAHAQTGRDVAEAGTVLLQNAGGVLPLSPRRDKSVAVIGADGGQTPSLLDQAVAAARKAAVAVVFASNYETEGADLTNIDLPADENQLISAVTAANPNTVVVLNTGSAVTMPWLGQVKGVIEAWYPGQDDGDEIASVLFGDVNPSGKLPVTFPQSLAQVPASTAAQWPGTNGTVQYSEGILVGYRWYTTKHITPMFPFGSGLSYTTFAFSHLGVRPGPRGTVQVTADVTNTGARAGADVAQLYVADRASTGEPAEQLKGFQRVMLQPGQTRPVSFSLDRSAFAWWDQQRNGWTVTPGSYGLLVGDSSANLPLTAHVAVP